MVFIKDKLLIFCILLCLYFTYTESLSVIPVLLIIFLSGLNTYLLTNSLQSNSLVKSQLLFIPPLGLVSYLLLSSTSPSYLFFLPLLIYDISKQKWDKLLQLVYIFFMICFLCFEIYSFKTILPCLITCFICYLLKIKSSTLNELIHTHYHSKYELESLTHLLTQKNKALLEKQDSEIHIATLNERNRIAREIHDNVGHLLSRCLLQIGALMTLSKNQNELIYNNLSQIKITLSEAMDSIRSSVHNLHDEALDLETEITKLIDAFNLCQIHLHYDITSSPCKEIKYSFIAITKEALSNIMKHAHPTLVEVTLKEHPTFYQLIIRDNDLHIKSISSNGIGLNNMQDRITQLNGQFSIDTSKGFRIFISVPKR